MRVVIGDILPLALVVTVSPLNVIPVILLLFTTRPVLQSSLFLAGFTLGVAVVLGGAVALASALEHSPRTDGDSRLAAVDPRTLRASACTLCDLAGVAARAVEMGLARFHHPIWTKLASATSVALGLTLLASGAGPVGVALMVYGAGIGLESIARGALPLALFGPVGYASLMGRLATPSLMAQAAAPWIGSLWLSRFGVDSTLIALAAGGLLNVALTLTLWTRVRPSP